MYNCALRTGGALTSSAYSLAHTGVTYRRLMEHTNTMDVDDSFELGASDPIMMGLNEGSIEYRSNDDDPMDGGDRRDATSFVLEDDTSGDILEVSNELNPQYTFIGNNSDGFEPNELAKALDQKLGSEDVLQNVAESIDIEDFESMDDAAEVEQVEERVVEKGSAARIAARTARSKRITPYVDESMHQAKGSRGVTTGTAADGRSKRKRVPEEGESRTPPPRKANAKKAKVDNTSPPAASLKKAAKEATKAKKAKKAPKAPARAPSAEEAKAVTFLKVVQTAVLERVKFRVDRIHTKEEKRAGKDKEKFWWSRQALDSEDFGGESDEDGPKLNTIVKSIVEEAEWDAFCKDFQVISFTTAGYYYGCRMTGVTMTFVHAGTVWRSVTKTRNTVTPIGPAPKDMAVLSWID